MLKATLGAARRVGLIACAAVFGVLLFSQVSAQQLNVAPNQFPAIALVAQTPELHIDKHSSDASGKSSFTYWLPTQGGSYVNSLSKDGFNDGDTLQIVNTSLTDNLVLPNGAGKAGAQFVNQGSTSVTILPLGNATYQRSGSPSQWAFVSQSAGPNGGASISGSVGQVGVISGTGNTVTGTSTLASYSLAGNVRSPATGSYVAGDPTSLPQFTAPSMASVTITGTAGQFACTCSNIAIGMYVTISGTYGGTGSITGYANPTRYYIWNTDGHSTFTLYTTAQAAIVTTAGTPTGLTYTLDTIAIGDQAFGFGALSANAGASYNEAFGYQALLSNTSGDYNNGFGNQALKANALGTNNNAFGAYTLFSNAGTGASTGYNSVPNGSYNAAFGDSDLQMNTTGSFNSAFGGTVMLWNTTGSDNTAGGFSSLYWNTTGSDNTAYGAFALYGTSPGDTGFNNSAFGANAMLNVTTASQNGAFGQSALQSITIGQYNNAFGYRSIASLSANYFNSAFGDQALTNATSDGSTAMGASACGTVTSGSYDLCLGYKSGNTTLQTGSFNILIGGNNSTTVDTVASGTSNEVNIGNAVMGYSNTGLVTVTSGGGTSPSVSGAGTFLFWVTEGATGTPGTALVLAMPTAGTDWACDALDRSSTTITARQTGAASTTAVTITFSGAPAVNDRIQVKCLMH